ncbi:MAG: aminoacyl-histidine dipeptidase [Deltaproteobacteria bacterium]|jgi:dipeptidase D|nr:aminoacyl-histidine dipeptidase [Deltaproteobacteria bacterium]
MRIEALEPKECFTWFAAIANIPRGSHNEQGISDFLVRFAQERGLAVSRDSLHNVCIKKPGSGGMEQAKPVILQGHMDMVCVKEEGRDFDFAKDPIQMRVNGDSVTAEGTTLGADNGIALAYILALLDARDIPHPPLEAVITTEEEVGMAGAAGFDAGQLTGAYFINLDSEEEGVFCVSCAGGRRSRVKLPLERTALASLPDQTALRFYSLAVSGLMGGHSGQEIHKQRGNAIRLLGRVLDGLARAFPLHVASLSGGTAANVIPSESAAVFCTGVGEDGLRQKLEEFAALFRNELKAADGRSLALTLTKAPPADAVFSTDTLRKALAILLLMPDGVFSMDLNITTQVLVESSSNLGVLTTDDTELVFSSLTRSSVRSRKELLYDRICAIAALTGASVESSGDYPAWEFNPDSPLRDVFLQAYKTLFAKEAKVEGIHAGLECGLFFEKLQTAGRKVDFIAFGPTITGAHTPKEAVSRRSVENTWRLLKEALRLLGSA